MFDLYFLSYIFFRPAVLRHGVWDQVRVDMGAEFNLTLFVQDLLSQYRRNSSRVPYVQTSSKEVRK